MSWAACRWQGWVRGPRLPHLPQPLPPIRTVCRETVPSLDPERTNVHSTVLVNDEVWRRVFVLLFYLQVQKQQTLAGICDGHQPNVRPHPLQRLGFPQAQLWRPQVRVLPQPQTGCTGWTQLPAVYTSSTVTLLSRVPSIQHPVFQTLLSSCVLTCYSGQLRGCNRPR